MLGLILCQPLASQATGGQRILQLYEQAQELRFFGDPYRAIDLLLEVVRLNPAYAPAWLELARCHYDLGEYQQALLQLEQAYRTGPEDSAARNLEAFCHINLGNLDRARQLFELVLSRQANNRDARFGLAVLEASRGNPAAARLGLTEALRGSPRDSRLLLSLALVLRAEGRESDAQAYLREALRWAGNDYQVAYTAALFYLEGGQEAEALRQAQVVLGVKPGHVGALNLLAGIHYDRAAYPEALSAIDRALLSDPNNQQAWFLLGQIHSALGRQEALLGRSAEAERQYAEAVRAYTSLLRLRPDDEIGRLALEQLIMDTTPFESPERAQYAAWRFARAAELEANLLYDKALAEYRQGLALDPYANQGRRRYAELLRLSKLPSSYFAELQFLQSQGRADRAVEEALEIYDSLLRGSLAREWRVDPLANVQAKPYRLQVYSSGPGGIPWHSGSDLIVSRHIRNLFTSSSQVAVDRPVPRISSFTDAFRPARESGADYFLLLAVQETASELYIQAELRAARTGALVLRLDTVRSGNDRVHLAAAHIVRSVLQALPLQGRLLERRADNGLINLGRSSGLAVGDELILLRPGSLSQAPEGTGLRYAESAIVADLVVRRLDDEVSQVEIIRRGFFDTVNPGDLVLRKPSIGQSAAPAAAARDSAATWPFLFERMRRLF